MKRYLKPIAGEIITQDHTKPVFIPDDLSQLKGPKTGQMKLPLHLDWTPKQTYDLTDDYDLRLYYATVLSEACSDADIEQYLNTSLLLDLWPDLKLPKRVRVVWELEKSEVRGC